MRKWVAIISDMYLPSFYFRKSGGFGFVAKENINERQNAEKAIRKELADERSTQVEAEFFASFKSMVGQIEYGLGRNG